MYDSYLPIIRQAGGIPRLVRLEPPHWRLNEDMLKSVFSSKTKAVLFNNPLNPSAVVFPREDLELLARYCQEFDVIAICDEVWEHVTFDEHKHIPLITMPGMRDRTIKVGSAGKIFSLTGWKIGFVCAAPPLLRVAAKVHQFLTFTTAPNLQAAVAYGHRQARRVFPVNAQGPDAEQRPPRQGAGEPRLPRAEVAGHLLPHRRPVAARA
ncbi:aspartate/methionine/tyrosine aminotransferase [Bradyrhizobium sp. LM6.11]